MTWTWTCQPNGVLTATMPGCTYTITPVSAHYTLRMTHDNGVIKQANRRMSVVGAKKWAEGYHEHVDRLASAC